LSGNVIDNVNNQGPGDDTVYGNPAANAICSLGGSDTVRGGGGDDFIHVQDQSGDDFVYCGDGNDTAHVDGGDAISLDCE
jgi:Ca2+-binding RTX toxin-like protein